MNEKDVIVRVMDLLADPKRSKMSSVQYAVTSWIRWASASTADGLSISSNSGKFLTSPNYDALTVNKV